MTTIYTPTTSDSHSSSVINECLNYAFPSFPVINWLFSHLWFLSEVNWWDAREYFPSSAFWASVLPLPGFPPFDVLPYHDIKVPYMKSRTLISSSASRNKFEVRGYVLLAKNISKGVTEYEMPSRESRNQAMNWLLMNINILHIAYCLAELLIPVYHSKDYKPCISNALL